VLTLPPSRRQSLGLCGHQPSRVSVRSVSGQTASCKWYWNEDVLIRTTAYVVTLIGEIWTITLPREIAATSGAKRPVCRARRNWSWVA
jgi:hypothetical protein